MEMFYLQHFPKKANIGFPQVNNVPLTADDVYV